MMAVIEFINSELDDLERRMAKLEHETFLLELYEAQFRGSEVKSD